MRHLGRVAALSICFVASAFAQQKAPLELAPFTSLCVEDAATGFDWRNGEWKAGRYHPKLKYMVQKIPESQYRNPPQSPNVPHVLCEPRVGADLNGYKISFGCYNIRESGEKLFPPNSVMCSEQWIKGELRTISCKEAQRPFFFVPDGNFIAYPWHADISIKPENNYKDSLAISVGRCSTVN